MWLIFQTEFQENVKEISRFLKNKGVYICVSYGDPDIRNHYFEDKSEKYDWGKKHQWPYKIFQADHIAKRKRAGVQ